MAFLEIRHLSKEYGGVPVLSDVSLSVEKGDIYGILGLSGAGKSTLVRCINGLETYSQGEIDLEGACLSSPSHPLNRKNRQKIGMIFQDFALLEQKTVLANVELALEIESSFLKEKKAKLRQEEEKALCSNPQDRKRIRKEYRKRISGLKEELARKAIQEVGLSGKESFYPSQLSGGQKQRVAIARALVVEPLLLLSDEATSALDPETTDSILALLSELNRKRGLTILLISHQMNVIEKICNKIAVLDHSRIVESGPFGDVYLAPKSDTARRLLYADHLKTSLTEKRLIRLLFDGNDDEPILAGIVEDCHLRLSVVYADTKVLDGKVYGQTVLKEPSEERKNERLKRYLGLHGIRYEEVTK